MSKETVSEGSSIYKARIKVCKGCEHSTKHLRATWCGTPLVGGGLLCGCCMNVKAKIKTSKCPLNKW